MLIKKLIEHFLFGIGSDKMRINIARKWGVTIGENCRILTKSFGSEPYLIKIGNHCKITSGVKFVTHDGGTWILRPNKDYLGSKFGTIVINDNCFIGIQSIIMPNVEIGPNSVVGAGSVVTRNIPPNCVYAGNPAKFICSYEEYLKKSMNNIGNTGINDHRSGNQKEIILDHFKDKLKK